jgi:hypothetical protein
VPSINGFLCTNDRAAIGVKTFTVPGTGVLPGRTAVKLALRADVAPLLIEFARWWHTEIEPIDIPPVDDWGYAARNVRGSNSPSFHWAGIATDTNALKHPLGKRGTFTADQRNRMKAKADTLGLRLGEFYTSRIDGMHAEVIVNVTRALQLVRALQAPAGAPPAAPSGPGRGDPTVRALQAATRIPTAQRDGIWGRQTDGALNLVRDAVHGRFPDVRAAQAVVGTPVDGDWGPASRRALTATIRAIQAALRVGVDGDWGPQTDRAWAAARARHGRGL